MGLLCDIQNLETEEILSEECLIELMSEISDVERVRDELALKERAKKLGCIMDFKRLLSAYKRDKKNFDKKQKVVNMDGAPCNVTNFGGEYDALNCGQWIADKNGVRINTPFGVRYACPHPILITKILINAETNLCKVVVAFKIRRTWREIVLDKEIISSAAKIVSAAKYGLSVTSENSRYLVQYLADLETLNEDAIAESVSTSRVGWLSGRFVPYFNNVVFDNEQNLKQVFDSITWHGDRGVWYDLARKIRKGGRFEPRIYMAAALASVLIEPLAALPFIVNLYGASGKGKTVALMFAASIWANPEEGRYISDPKSTQTALEVRLNFLNSLPLLLDDMAQVKTRRDFNLADMVYYWCSGKGRERSNRNFGLNASTYWRNCILTNGEHALTTATMQGGAVNRIIDVEIDEGYIFEHANKTVEILRQNYGYCGKDFIDVIQAKGIDYIRVIQKDFYQQITDIAALFDCEKEEKQILPMSIILTADKIATEELFGDGQYLNVTQCVKLLKSVGEVSENERCYAFICDNVQINLNKFKPDDDGNFRGEQWGLLDEETAIIIGTAFDNMVTKAGFDPKTFLSWAVKRGLVTPDNKGNAKRVKYIDGRTVRCVYLKTGDGFSDADKTPFD